MAQAEDFYGQAKGKAGQYYDAAKGEAGGYIDAAGNYVAAGQRKAGEAYDAAKGKAGEYADSAQVTTTWTLPLKHHCKPLPRVTPCGFRSMVWCQSGGIFMAHLCCGHRRATTAPPRGLTRLGKSCCHAC